MMPLVLTMAVQEGFVESDVSVSMVIGASKWEVSMANGSCYLRCNLTPKDFHALRRMIEHQIREGREETPVGGA